MIIVDNCVNTNAEDNIISPSFLFYLDLIAANFPPVSSFAPACVI